MGQEEVFCVHPLRHGPQVRGAALAIKNLWRHSAVPVWSHDRMHRRMHDDIHSFRQQLDLIGGRVCARLRKHVVGCVTPDHEAAGGRIHAIGGVARDVGGSDRADLHIAKRPDNLRLLRCLECDQVGQFSRSASEADVAAAFNPPLGNFAGLQERIANMRDEFLTADGKAELRRHVAAAHDVEHWPPRIPGPAVEHDIGEALGVIRVHMGEENSVELDRGYVELREPHIGPAPGIDQQLHGAALVAVVSEADQGACARLPVEDCRAALRAGQRDEKTRSSFRRWHDGRDPKADDRRRNGKSFHVFTPQSAVLLSDTERPIGKWCKALLALHVNSRQRGHLIALR